LNEGGRGAKPPPVANASSPDPQDPRLRRFRQGMLGLYILLTVAFCVHLAVSVFRSTGEMTFSAQAPASAPRPEAECVAGLQGLWTELEQQRGEMSAGSALAADQRFLTFRAQWFPRFRMLEAACAPGRPAQAELFKALEKLADLYTTLAVRYAGEAGPTVERLRAGLGAAR